MAAALASSLARSAASRAALAAPIGSGPENILAGAMWDDGRAELSVYTGTTKRYGQDRPTIAHLVVVKEDLLRESLVKSDSGPIPGKTLTAVKLNFIADFPTGTYSYHQMATVMFDRANFEVLKETMSHTEGCGITFVRIGPQHGALVHEAHSYWDGEADREVKIAWPAGTHMYQDALPVWLRQWVHDGAPDRLTVWLMPPQISGQSPIENTRPVEARISRSDGGTVRVPAGAFATRAFAVTTAAGTDRYWFDAKFPYVLVRLETAAGRRLSLKKTQRLDYWNHHMNGDEKLLE
jgi:hypothetical protein